MATKHNETQSQLQKTAAEQIWDEIKGLQIDMFALPGQVVEMYLVPAPIDPSRCFLTYKASSVIPSLEVSLGINPAQPTEGKYILEQQGNYIIISRGPAHRGV